MPASPTTWAKNQMAVSIHHTSRVNACGFTFFAKISLK